jgi:sec-independent protein translocase protein TatB
MPSFPDSIFLFVLALLLFGPKRLPVLARELGKWVGEFRRASNEFKMQMEEELRLTEQTDRQKKIAAMEAAAPVNPPIPDPEHPHLPAPAATHADASHETTVTETAEIESISTPAAPAYELIDGVRTPLPIATSGDLRIMPPSTGLPRPQQPSESRNSALKDLIDSIPAASESPVEAAPATETSAHGN